MKRIILKMLCVFAIVANGNGEASDIPVGHQGWYIGGSLGLNNPAKAFDLMKLDYSKIFGICAGYKFKKYLRIEEQFLFCRNKFRQKSFFNKQDVILGHINRWSYTDNLLFDFDNCSQFTPYIGAGIGFRYWTGKGSSKITGRDVRPRYFEFVYQGITGLHYSFLSNDVGIEYRYLRGKRRSNDHMISLNFKHYISLGELFQ